MKRIVLITEIGGANIKVRLKDGYFGDRDTIGGHWFGNYSEQDTPTVTIFYSMGERAKRKFNEVKLETNWLKPRLLSSINKLKEL